MAAFVELEPDVFVAPQLAEADFATLAGRGFVAVVSHLPDGEVPDQLSSDAAAAAAERHGLAYRHLPVMNMNVIDDDVVETQAGVMATLTGRTLFYCRSGNRCTILWAQTAVARLGVDETIARAANAGFDIEGFRDHLEELAGRLAEAA